jgi:hypothetical protein
MVLEVFDEVSEYGCPSCEEKLAVVLHPTTAESRENWADLDETERAYVERIEQGQREFAERALKRAEQLPEISLPAFALVWDRDGPEIGDGDTVIRLGDRVLWREPEVYEGYWRYREIVELLKARYGTRLQDVEPSAVSELYLYGDQLSSPDQVRKVRNELRQAAAVPLAAL